MTHSPQPVGFPQGTFLREYGDAVVEGNAAVFVGAGMSFASGYVDWRGLLADFADELGLDLDIETDLVSVAQYHLNENENNRNRLAQKIVDEFSDAKEPTESHLTLAKLPISLWWTTNYDDVVERSIRLVDRKPHTISSTANLTVRPKGTDAIVVKMHGDLSNLENIVIARDDYEEYVEKSSAFRTRLENDLTANTFLFLGFSFTDPNFDFILSELRRIHRRNAKTHYALMRREALVDDDDKRAKSEYAIRRQELRIKDLMRYGIQTVLVEDHDEIPELIRRLRQRYLRRHVFVTGAQADTEDSAAAVSSFSTTLGRGLMDAGYNLVSGLGLGVGGAAVFGALDVLYTEKASRIDRRLQLWPFPQDVPPDQRADLYSNYRQTMLATVGFAVVVAGSKVQDGETVTASGVEQEIEIALANKAFVIPVGRTGHLAAELWAQYDADLAVPYGTAIDPDAWALLNDASATDEAVVAAVIKIMDELRPR